MRTTTRLPRRSLEAAACNSQQARSRTKRPREQRPDVDRLCRLVSSQTQFQTAGTQQLLDLKLIDDDQGWGFVARADIEEGETLVSVPLSETIIGVDDPDMEVPWNVQMARQLLEKLYSGAAEAWMDALPVHVDIPFLYWSDEEVAQLADPGIIEDINTLREFCLSAGVRDHLSEFEWDDVLWAVSMIHSRSFVYAEGKHLLCPLIDMANHADEPNATVNLSFNTDSCQGQEAVDEIAPPTHSLSPSVEEQSVFKLVATRDVRTDEHVTISYGAQPNDVLLLYFGFALPSNEYDVVSFTPQDLKVVLGTTVTGQETDRFFVTRHGVDPRLSERISSSAELAALCKHRLDRLLEIENKYIATEGHERSAASRTHTAAAFRRNKISLLNAVISSLKST